MTSYSHEGTESRSLLTGNLTCTVSGVVQRSETERLVAAFERSAVAAADADMLARLTMQDALHSIQQCAATQQGLDLGARTALHSV